MGSNQTGLSLDLLGFKKLDKPAPSIKLDHDYPALSLGPVDHLIDGTQGGRSIPGFSVSPGSSSYSNNYSKRSVDQEKEEAEVEKVSSRGSDEAEEGEEEEEEEEASPRKKLRLNKDQSAVLEDSFKQHSTLTPHQKQALAKLLNLRPRQVEVWFQNRRARTKLKQTEMDCEVMKKCCERLTEENKRLQKEIHDLKTLSRLAATTTPPVYMQASMCPSCERFVTTTAPAIDQRNHHHRHHVTPSAAGGGAAAAGFQNINATNYKLPGFFTHSSAAC